jgi:hypothetical protein
VPEVLGSHRRQAFLQSLSVYLLLYSVSRKSDHQALFPQRCRNVKKFPTLTILHIGFQSARASSERVKTKLIHFSILWASYDSPGILPRAPAPPMGKKFPKCAFPGIVTEEHSPIGLLKRLQYCNK